MKHVVYNHLSTVTYSSFVPLATQKSNGTAFKVIIGLAALGLLFWWITQPGKNEPEDKPEINKE
jgi:hypothetical protein